MSEPEKERTFDYFAKVISFYFSSAHELRSEDTEKARKAGFQII